MAIYIVILLLIFIVNLISTNKLGKIDVCFFILLALISGFRYNVGTDFFNYIRIFETIRAGQEVSVEPGFVFLSNLISVLGLSSQALFLVLSTLTILFLYKGISYYTNNDYIYKPVLYIIMLLFLFIPSLNVVRQILASAIILYGTRHIVNRKLLRFSFWVVIASMFHYSSLIFIILYFILNKDFKRVNLFIILMLSIIIARYELITALLGLILKNLGFLDINGYIGNYLNSSYNSKELELGMLFIIHFFVLLLFILLKKRLVTNDKSLVVFNLFYLYVLNYILAFDAFVFTRFSYFFGIYMAIFIPRFGLIFEERSRKIVEYTLLVLYSLLYLYIIVFIQDHDIIPYDYNFKLRD